MKNVWIEKIEEMLRNNNVAYETDGQYINILNSSTMTRIKVFEYVFDYTNNLKSTAIEVQEFDANGKLTYRKEFAHLGKSFFNRVTKNIG